MVSRLQANYTLHQSVSDSYTIWKMLLRLSEFVRGGRGWRGGGVSLNLTFPFNARMILKYLQSNALTSYIGTGQQWENVTHWIAMQRGFHLFSLLYVLCLIPITVWPHPLLHSFCFLCFSICFFNFMSLICLCSSTPLCSSTSSILLPLHPSPPCLLFGCPSISLSLSLSFIFCFATHTYGVASSPSPGTFCIPRSVAAKSLIQPHTVLSLFPHFCVPPPLWQDHLAATEGHLHSRCVSLNNDHSRTRIVLSHTNTHWAANQCTFFMPRISPFVSSSLSRIQTDSRCLIQTE